jgi:hypothetical protein
MAVLQKAPWGSVALDAILALDYQTAVSFVRAPCETKMLTLGDEYGPFVMYCLDDLFPRFPLFFDADGGDTWHCASSNGGWSAAHFEYGISRVIVNGSSLHCFGNQETSRRCPFAVVLCHEIVGNP